MFWFCFVEYLVCVCVCEIVCVRLWLCRSEDTLGSQSSFFTLRQGLSLSLFIFVQLTFELLLSLFPSPHGITEITDEDTVCRLAWVVEIWIQVLTVECQTLYSLNSVLLTLGFKRYFDLYCFRDLVKVIDCFCQLPVEELLFLWIFSWIFEFFLHWFINSFLSRKCFSWVY